jgi:hypothetical protein
MQKQIKAWRVKPAEDTYGWFVYFDASTELLTLRDLTEAEKLDRLDKLGSVSASEPIDYSEESDGCDGTTSLGSLLGQFALDFPEVPDNG